MARPQPAIIRCADNIYGWDVWAPISNSDSPYAPWVRYGLRQPVWDNANPPLSSSFNIVSLQHITAGIVRPCRMNTWQNARLTLSRAGVRPVSGGAWPTSGAWTAQDTSLGNTTGLHYRYSASTAARTLWAYFTVRAGDDKIIVRYNCADNANGKTLSVEVNEVAVPGGTDHTTYRAGGAGVYTVNDLVLSITPAAVDRVGAIYEGAGGAGLGWPTLKLIAVLTFDSDGVADPRELDGTDGLAVGNQHYETYADMRSGISSGSVTHCQNTHALECYRIGKPNQIHLVFNQDNATGTKKPTGDGFHFGATDYKLLPLAGSEATLTVDGAGMGLLTAAPGTAYGTVTLGDSIVVTFTGGCGSTGAGVTRVAYTYTFTVDNVAMGAVVTFANAALFDYLYHPSISFEPLAAPLGPLATQTGYCTIGTGLTQYAIGSAADTAATSINIFLSGCPYVARLTPTVGTANLYMTGTTSKVYTKPDISGLTTPANGVTWTFGGTLDVTTRGGSGGVASGMGMTGFF